MVEIICHVKGIVQGVSYRDYVQTSADELGLVGWVKNMSDGTVVVCVQGEPDNLKNMVEYLHEGSLRSEVDSVTVEWGNVTVIYDDFSILH